MTKKASHLELYARVLMEANEDFASPALERLDREIMRHPGGCLDALAEIARLPGGIDHELSAGYAMLIGTWLTTLRFMAESGRAEAAGALADFQCRLAALARDGDIAPDFFIALTTALGEAGIKAAPEVEAAMQGLADDFAGGDEALSPGESNVGAVLDGMSAMVGDNPFAFVATLMEVGHAMPIAAKAVMAAEIAQREDTSGAGVLLLLDPAREVRVAAAEGLAGVAGRLDGVALRRLIAVRNWVPEEHRGAIDAIVHAARASIACASWPDSRLEEISASALDGAGAQGFLIVTREGRKRFLSSILTKRGVRDAWTAPQTKAELARALSTARREAGAAVVSRRYLDSAVRHHLSVGLAERLPPPAGLLEITEAIGASDWMPQAFDWRAELDALTALLPAHAAAGESRRKILEHSEFWSLHEAAHDSWFEEGQQVTQALVSFKRRDRGRAIEHVLAHVLDPARDKWAEHFAWIAFCLHECEKAGERWENFGVLAAELARGAPVSDIPVMRAIAARTVEAAWQR